MAISRAVESILQILTIFLILISPSYIDGQCAPGRLFALGAKTSKWGPVGIVQSKLGENPDGILGVNTQNAILRFQAAEKLEATGNLDAPTWKALTHLDSPTVKERARELTFRLEGTDFDDWEWNFPFESRDRSGATWGPDGLTILDNEIQAVFGKLNATTPSLLSQSFAELYPVVQELKGKKGAEAKQYLRANVYEVPSARDAWVKAIKSLAKDARVRKAYTDFSQANFAGKMKTFNEAYPVRTELDYAFYWDLAVHTSGLTARRKTEIDAALRAPRPTTPDEQRAVICEIFENTPGNKSQQQSRRERDAVYVNGNGRVHGDLVDATAYGLGNCPYHWRSD